jgi:hypothetical protein
MKNFDRTLLWETLNFMMFYQRTALIWWQIGKGLSFGFSKALTIFLSVIL